MSVASTHSVHSLRSSRSLLAGHRPLSEIYYIDDNKSPLDGPFDAHHQHSNAHHHQQHTGGHQGGLGGLFGGSNSSLGGALRPITKGDGAGQNHRSDGHRAHFAPSTVGGSHREGLAAVPEAERVPLMQRNNADGKGTHLNSKKKFSLEEASAFWDLIWLHLIGSYQSITWSS